MRWRKANMSDKWIRQGASVSNNDTEGFLQFVKSREIVRTQKQRIESLESDVLTLKRLYNEQQEQIRELMNNVQK
ncbi:hypothetical protein SHAb15599_00148 [Acinetobacter phage SH-Ab 15599]|nr:hypothetical protein SHAb15599_00148 [Acinetobacter phage SH-Ab 15599]